MINICLAYQDFDGNYSKYAGAVLASVFLNTASKIHVYLLHDETLSSENKKKLTDLVRENGQTISFCNVRISDEFKSCLEGVKRTSIFTLGSYFRIFLPQIINEEKIIYLDCDIVVNMDIKKLWDIDLKNYYLAAIPELKMGIEGNRKNIDYCGLSAEHYFNSGVLLFSLANIRNYINWYERFLDFFRKFPLTFNPDQDALNFVYGNHYLEISPEFNYLYTITGPFVVSSQQKIYHYASNSGEKPWKLYAPEVELVWKYLLKTPWKDTVSDDILMASRRMYAHYFQTLKMLKLVTESSKKVIIFGTGSACKRILDVFKFDVFYYIDNNQNKWGTTFQHRKIYPPNYLLSEKPSEIIVIVASQFSEDIINQLHLLGLKEEIIDFKPLLFNRILFELSLSHG